MHRLALKIPPPIVAILVALAMWPLSGTLPPVAVAAPVRIAAGCVVALLGVSFALAGVVAFRRAITTVNPLRPEQTSSLVVTGIYRVSRNPMYVGMMLVLLAWAIVLASPVALAGPVAFIVYMNRFQIEPEEAVLRAKFGQAFETYMRRVRRWI